MGDHRKSKLKRRVRDLERANKRLSGEKAKSKLRITQMQQEVEYTKRVNGWQTSEMLCHAVIKMYDLAANQLVYIEKRIEKMEMWFLLIYLSILVVGIFVICP